MENRSGNYRQLPGNITGNGELPVFGKAATGPEGFRGMTPAVCTSCAGGGLGVGGGLGIGGGL